MSKDTIKINVKIISFFIKSQIMLKLREKLKEIGVPLEEIAEKCGIPRTTVNNVLIGTCKTQRFVLPVLKVSLEELKKNEAQFKEAEMEILALSKEIDAIISSGFATTLSNAKKQERSQLAIPC
jgi:predicted XRE-type DNA-binding protein